jgi:multiple sugar transport system permease protein
MKRSAVDREAILLVLPSVLLLAGVAFVPIGMAMAMSLRRIVVVFHEDTFVGLDNYRFLLEDARFRTALANTGYFAVVSIAVELFLALPLALLLDARVPGRGLLRAALLVPWAVPSAVAAKMWGWLFSPDHGLVVRLLPTSDVNWLGTPGYAMHAAIVADVWKSTPFMVLLLLAGLGAIPADIHRAAEVDGASAFQRFTRITLPLLRPAIATAVLFRALDAARVFDVVYVLTEGGPAGSTETLSIYAYKMLMRAGNFGYGTTLAVVTFFVVLLFSLGYVRLFGTLGDAGRPSDARTRGKGGRP